MLLIRKLDHYFRYEKDGFITLHSKTYGTQFLNTVAAFIYNNIGNSTSVDELREKLEIRFPSVPKNKLKIDLEDFLMTIANMGFVEINETLPVKDGVRLADERDYDILSKYILKFLDKKYPVMGYSAFCERNIYSVPMLRTRSFTLAEIFLVSIREGEVNSAIAFSGLNASQETISLSLIVYNNNSDMRVLFDYSKNLLRSRGVNKIKFNVINDGREDQEPIISLICDLGFSYECTLKKEVSGSDVDIYSLFLK